MDKTSEEYTTAGEGCYQISTCHCFRKKKSIEISKLTCHPTTKTYHHTAPMATFPSQNRMTPSHSEGKGWADTNLKL